MFSQITGNSPFFVAASGERLKERQAAEEAVDEQTTFLGPHRMHGCTGFPAAALPAVRMGPCVSFLLITCGKQPGSAKAELDTESLQSPVQLPAAHAQLLGDLRDRVSAWRVEHLVEITYFRGLQAQFKGVQRVFLFQSGYVPVTLSQLGFRQLQGPREQFRVRFPLFLQQVAALLERAGDQLVEDPAFEPLGRGQAATGHQAVQVPLVDELHFLPAACRQEVVDAYPLRPAMPVDGILGIGISQCRGHVPGAKPDPTSGFHGPDLAELGMFCYD